MTVYWDLWNHKFTLVTKTYIYRVVLILQSSSADPYDNPMKFITILILRVRKLRYREVK